MKIVSVVGARPNFMKIAPLAKEFKKIPSVKHTLVHTGQHYDHKMSQLFFNELGIPKPDINLGVGSGSHAQQTAQIIAAFEKVLLKLKPDLVVVVGDVNSTMACTLVASKLHIPVAHVEAGLRSFDRSMPEEVNRMVTDSISDILFTTCRDADKNLIKEGVPKSKIFFVGNIMIDTLKEHLKKAKRADALKKYSLKKKGYILVTLHRPSNVDDKKVLKDIMGAFADIQEHIKIVFPVHPRTRRNLNGTFRNGHLKGLKNLVLLNPLGYFEFLNLMQNAKLVMTDSGGIQEETTVLGVPCLTIRNNTERPVTITEGTNILVGNDKQRIIKESMKIIRGSKKNGKKPKLWDGKTAGRIAKKLVQLRKQKRI